MYVYMYKGMRGARTFSGGVNVEDDRNFLPCRQHDYLEKLVNFAIFKHAGK